jgi:hypothetical protein
LGFSKANSNGGTLGASIAPTMDGSGQTTALTFGVASGGGSVTERLRIDSSGNVTLGAGGTYRLDINAPTSSAAKITCDNTSMEIGTFDNHVVKFLQNNTERMRLDSSANLLVGRTSTSTSVAGVTIPASGAIQATANFNPLGLNRLSGNGNIAVFQKSGTTVGSIGVSNSALYVGRGGSALNFYDGGSKIILPSSGGTDSDATTDLGYSGARFKDLYLSNSAYVKNIGGISDADTYLNFGDVANTIKAFTGGSERMRLDASGNLLVGKTSTSSAFTTPGVDLRPEGRSFMTRSAGPSLYLSRTTSDGNILEFYKDSTTVGSIGAVGGSVYISSPQGSDAGLQFGNSIVGPATTTGGNRDNAISLGWSANRFKDLYLGGGLRADTLTFSNLAGSERMRIDSSGRLQVGTTSAINDGVISALGSGRQAITAKVTNNANSLFQGFNSSGTAVIQAIGNGNLYLKAPTGNHTLQLESSAGSSTINFVTSNGTVNTKIKSGVGGSANLQFETAGSERARLDSSANLLVGTTSDNVANQTGTTQGVRIAGGSIKNIQVASTGTTAYFNRLTTDGSIAEFRKDGTTVGSIGSSGGVAAYLVLRSDSGGMGITASGNRLVPTNNTGATQDNVHDLGKSSIRWNDIYATNGTIQTSDRNEKQDIEALSEAEQRVAVAAKGLLRKFRWIDSVDEKGDDARIHFGIIAQDLQAAFEAEGLDAGRYAMFINSTWTDEETGEERSRMGVRYNQLLAFIIAAI